MNSIYVLGSINMDLVFDLNQLPSKGETIHCKKFFMSPGGKGANQAIACAKQEMNTYMIGTVGNDPLSSISLQSLQEAKVSTHFVNQTEKASVGVAGIFIENSDNRIVVDPGANQYADKTTILDVISSLDSSDILIAQLEIPLDIIAASFQKAKERGVKTILNAAPAYILPISIYSYIDLIIVNESETKILTNVYPKDETSLRIAATKFLEYGASEVLITLGEKGSYYRSNDIEIMQEAYKVVPVDTTAAGDTYIGVYVSCMIQGISIKASMKKASIASSIAITRYGATASIPTKIEIEQKMKEISNE